MSGVEYPLLASMAPAATASAVPAVLGTTAMLAPPIAIGLGNQAAMGVAASGAATKATVGPQIANLAASQTPILNPMMIGNASSATSPFLTQGALANVSADGGLLADSIVSNAFSQFANNPMNLMRLGNSLMSQGGQPQTQINRRMQMAAKPVKTASPIQRLYRQEEDIFNPMYI